MTESLQNGVPQIGVPMVWVYPRVSPRFFHVHLDGAGMTGGYAGRDGLELWRESDDARCESYYLGYGSPSEHWRLATPDEVALALWSWMLEDEDGEPMESLPKKR